MINYTQLLFFLNVFLFLQGTVIGQKNPPEMIFHEVYKALGEYNSFEGREDKTVTNSDVNSYSSSTDSVEKKSNLTERITSRLEQNNVKFPREKVYLQTDKNIYQPGDTMWLKGYILGHSTNLKTQLSNTFYVAIYNETGRLVQSRKIPVTQDGAAGDFVLADTLPDGFYRIAAYSSWMKNYGPQTVHIKDFEVRKIYTKDVFVRLAYNNARYNPRDTVSAEILITAINNKPLPDMRFDYDLISDGDRVLSGKGRTSIVGRDDIQFILPETSFTPILHLIIHDDESEIKKIYRIPGYSRDIDLQFFPEGGDLVGEITSRVAFKAIDESGRHVNIKGVILNRSMEVLQSFEFTYGGMGEFYLTPDLSEEYFARIDSPAGNDKLYKIPQCKKAGMVMEIDSVSEGEIRVKIKSSLSQKKEHICVILQSRGIKYWGIEGKISDNAILHIPVENIPPGIASITLFNKYMAPISERLFFANKNRNIKIEVTTDKDVYFPRERISATVKVADDKGNPAPACLSMAVTDEKLSVNPRINSGNILSSLLLQSELKGNIPNPNYYFEKDDSLTNKALDLVLLTNGWRRFSWDSIIGIHPGLLPDPVLHDVISGSVKKSNGKPVPFANLIVTQFNPVRITELQATEEGRFQFNFSLYPDSLNKIGIIATTQKGRKNVEVTLDDPENDPFVSRLTNFIRNTGGIPLPYLLSVYGIRQFTYLDDAFDLHDTRLIPEVSITSRLKNEESIATFHSKYFGNFKTGEELNPNLPIDLWILDIHSTAQLVNGEILFRRNPINFNDLAGFNYGTPLIVVDDNYRGLTFSFLRMFDREQIENIGTLDGEEAFLMYGELGIYGAIIVNTKKDYIQKATTDKNIAMVNIYSPTREFYIPKYKTDYQKNMSIPDFRTTIHWEPNLVIDDSGITHVSFYNADRPCTIRGVIEGVGLKGTLGYQKFNYRVRPKLIE